MHQHWRAVAMAGLFASVTGCGGVTVREVAPTNPNALPAMTVERLQACTVEFGGQLEPGQYNVHPVVMVDTDGISRGVEMDGLPATASDLASCMRIALRDMAPPAAVFNMRRTQTALTTEPTVEQRLNLGNPLVVVVIVVEVGEIVLEAGAITILMATTVKVVDKAAEDVMEAAKRWRPRPNKNRCLDAAAGGTYLWEEFCRSMKQPGSCWSKTYESEQNKRGWCNETFGS